LKWQRTGRLEKNSLLSRGSKSGSGGGCGFLHIVIVIFVHLFFVFFFVCRCGGGVGDRDVLLGERFEVLEDSLFRIGLGLSLRWVCDR